MSFTVALSFIDSVTVHHPRYSIFKTFDTISLLSDGEFTYRGPANQAMKYFEDIGDYYSSLCAFQSIVEYNFAHCFAFVFLSHVIAAKILHHIGTYRRQSKNLLATSSPGSSWLSATFLKTEEPGVVVSFPELPVFALRVIGYVGYVHLQLTQEILQPSTASYVLHMAIL